MKVNRQISIYEKTLQGNLNKEGDDLISLIKIDNQQSQKPLVTFSKGTLVETRDFNEEKEKEIKKKLEIHNSNPFSNLSYLPKRKIKFNASNLFSYSNNPPRLLSRKSEENKESNKITPTVIINNSSKLGSNNFNTLHNLCLNENQITNSISENEYLTFKTNYILKFARNKESYQKISNFISKISDENKKQVMEYYRKLMQVTEKKERVLFDSMNFNVMNSMVNTSDVNLNYQNWKECTLLFYELEAYWLRLCEIALKELYAAKESNIHLAKKLSDQTHLLSNRDNQIIKLKSFIEENDLVSNSSKANKKIQDLDKIRDEFKKKENMNIYNINRLEEEIRELTSLLDKDKDYYSKYLESIELMESKKREIDEMRLKYNNDLEEKKLKLSYLSNEKYELNQTIKVLETQLSTLQKNFDANNKEFINYETQIKILRQSLGEKMENILMLTEESDIWRLAYENEIRDHKNTKELVQTLEIKILSLKKEKSKLNI